MKLVHLVWFLGLIELNIVSFTCGRLLMLKIFLYTVSLCAGGNKLIHYPVICYSGSFSDDSIWDVGCLFLSGKLCEGCKVTIQTETPPKKEQSNTANGKEKTHKSYIWEHKFLFIIWSLFYYYLEPNMRWQKKYVIIWFSLFTLSFYSLQLYTYRTRRE